MSTEEIKSTLIKKIVNTDDREFLEDIQLMFEDKNRNSHKLKLTSEQEEIIDNAIREIEKGNYSTNEEFEKKIDEWLKK